MSLCWNKLSTFHSLSWKWNLIKSFTLLYYACSASNGVTASWQFSLAQCTQCCRATFGLEKNFAQLRLVFFPLRYFITFHILVLCRFSFGHHKILPAIRKLVSLILMPSRDVYISGNFLSSSWMSANRRFSMHSEQSWMVGAAHSQRLYIYLFESLHHFISRLLLFYLHLAALLTAQLIHSVLQLAWILPIKKCVCELHSRSLYMICRNA